MIDKSPRNKVVANPPDTGPKFPKSPRTFFGGSWVTASKLVGKEFMVGLIHSVFSCAGYPFEGYLYRIEILFQTANCVCSKTHYNPGRGRAHPNSSGGSEVFRKEVTSAPSQTRQCMHSLQKGLFLKKFKALFIHQKRIFQRNAFLFVTKIMRMNCWKFNHIFEKMCGRYIWR